MISPQKALRKLGRRPLKSLGQHFLIHQATAEKIAAASSPAPDDVIIEIGTGLGALTAPLSRSGARVIALEIDLELIRFLREEVLEEAPENVSFLCMDVLDLDLEKAYRQYRQRLKVIGNLPYHISSPVLFKLMESAPCIQEAVLMLQNEVAERVLAEPGSRDHGVLSVMAAFHSERRRLMRVRSSQFYPQPKVDSTVVGLRFRPWPGEVEVEAEQLRRLVRAAFGHRRKTLRNSLLAAGLGLRPEAVDEVLKETGIDPRRRPESLEVQEYIWLARGIEHRAGRPGGWDAGRLGQQAAEVRASEPQSFRERRISISEKSEKGSKAGKGNQAV